MALSDGHAGGLAFDELDAAGGAAVPAAGVQLVDSRILLQGEHQPLSLWHFELARTSIDNVGIVLSFRVLEVPLHYFIQMSKPQAGDQFRALKE